MPPHLKHQYNFLEGFSKSALSISADRQQQQLVVIPGAPEWHPATHAAPGGGGGKGERRREPQEGAGQPTQRTLLRLLHTSTTGVGRRAQEARNACWTGG